MPLRRLIPQRPFPALPPEWRSGILLLILTAFFMSGFFDTLLQQVFGIREVSRTIRASIAITIAAVLGYGALHALSGTVPADYARRRRPAFEAPLIGIVALTPLWVVIGLINAWPLTYVVGDVFMLCIAPLAYFTLTRRPLGDVKTIFRWIYGLGLGMAILSTLLVIQHNLIERHSHKMSLDAAILPIFYIMLKTHPSWAEVALLPFFALGALLTSKRSTWAATAIVILLALVMRPGVRRPFRLALMVGMAVLIVVVTQQQRPDWTDHAQTLLERRLDETEEDLSGRGRSDLSASSGGRMSEIVGVLDTMEERREPVDWILGMGLGAIVQARGGRLRHHIHSTPMAFLARTGVLGLVLWLAFVVLVFRELLVRTLRPQEEWFRVQMLFWIGLWISAAVFSLKSQAFWGSAVLGVQLAYLQHMMRAADAAAPVHATVAHPLQHAPTRRRLTTALRPTQA